MRSRRPRIGYTLLEVILATSIALVLLAALFTTLKLLITGNASMNDLGGDRSPCATRPHIKADCGSLLVPKIQP